MTTTKKLYTINKELEVVETTNMRSNPSSEDRSALKLFLKDNLSVMEDFFHSEDNHGIAFHKCGFNGRAQQEFIQSWRDNKVEVF